MLAKSRPRKKPKPKNEVKPSEKKGSLSPKEPGDQSCYRCLGNHDHKSCPLPSFHKQRQVPYALRPKVEAELTRLEKDGILSKVEYSEWATPVVTVVKRNGSVRVCGDFKVSVNPVLLAEQYPLPHIQDILGNLAVGKHFSKLDLCQAYHQMEVTEESKKFLTINTHKGLFQYNRLVFGISSCPAIWQSAIDQVLQGIPGTQCILNDMIVIIIIIIIIIKVIIIIIIMIY